MSGWEVFVVTCLVWAESASIPNTRFNGLTIEVVTADRLALSRLPQVMPSARVPQFQSPLVQRPRFVCEMTGGLQTASYSIPSRLPLDLLT